jgi:hypothetical protein
MDGSPEEGIIRNQTLMREVNDRAIEALHGAATDDIDLICECGDFACFETVRLTVSAYQTLRDSGAFVLAPEHAPADAWGGPAVVPSL